MIEYCRVTTWLDSDTAVLLRYRSNETGKKRSHMVRESVQEFLARKPKVTEVVKWLDSYCNLPRWARCYTLPTELIQALDDYIMSTAKELERPPLTKSEILRYAIYHYLHGWKK